MKNNKVTGIIFGVLSGFLFVIACTTELNSEESETVSTSSNGKYQISTNVTFKDPYIYYHEVIMDTETGEVISRKFSDDNNGDFSNYFERLNP
jgi:hypothetical protein